MSKRKIADCVNIRIRVGDFEHIEVVKYAEEEIEYTDAQDRIAKEDALTNSLVDSVMRSLMSIPERLKKGKTQAIEVEQKIMKAIPAWLANEPVPNIANGAKKAFNTEVDKQQKEKEKAIKADKSILPDEDAKIVKSESNMSKEDFKAAVEDSKTVATLVISKDDADKLFEEDVPKSDKIVEPKSNNVEAASTLVQPVAATNVKVDDGFDLFSETEDLFGDK